MKIMQINAVYGQGSTGVITKDIHEMALSEGLESYVAYSIAPKSIESSIVNGYAIGNLLERKIHALLSRINGEQGYFSSLSTKKLLKHIDKISPDVVHLHNLHSNYINLNMLLKFLAKRNIATVLTIHDCWFYTGGCFHYTEVGCDKWTKNCGSCPKKHSDFPAYFLDRSSKILNDKRKYFSRIKNLTSVGVSDWIADETRKSFLGNAEVTRIYNGIDLDFFKYTESDIKKELGIEGKTVVLGMANKWLMPKNRVAFEYVVSRLPDDAIMLMVGCSDAQLSALPEKVKGIGYIRDRATLRNIYSASDVFINCTREETLSLVNVEAQACGLPIVTYSNTGAKETVDNIISFSVKDGDYIALTDKLLYIIENKSAFANKKCSDFIKNRFNVMNNYKEYIELYSEIYRKCNSTKTEGNT